jgi:limonene-1,2-epoxide hydrolase
LVGTVNIRSVFEAFLDAFASARLEIITIAGAPDLVLAERIDHFVMKSGAVVTLPVTGVFEIRERKIVRFSDYFDLAAFETASGLKL